MIGDGGVGVMAQAGVERERDKLISPVQLIDWLPAERLFETDPPRRLSFDS